MAMIDPKEIEQSLLGCMLMDTSILPDVLSFISADDFKYPQHAKLFTVCKELFNSNKTIDVITVLGQFGETKEHKIFVTRLCEIVPSIKAYREYMQLVKNSAKRRKAYELAANILERLDDNSPIEDCMSMACDITQALLDGGNNRGRTALDGFTSVYSKLGQERKYIETGFSRLDKNVKIKKGNYIIVAGRPSTGKTALTLQIMLNTAKNYRTVYFSLETGEDEIFERLMSLYSGVLYSEIQDGVLSDYVKLAEASNSFAKLNFVVVEAAGWTVDQIQAEAVKQKADIIFIDYLSLIRGKGKSLYEQVTNISKDLHIMAQNRKIAVVALSQLNRNDTDKPKTTPAEPKMSDLRDSGQIEQDADSILMLFTPCDAENTERIIKIAKNKRGICGKWKLRFNGEIQRFYEVEERRYG